MVQYVLGALRESAAERARRVPWGWANPSSQVCWSLLREVPSLVEFAFGVCKKKVSKV